MGRFIHRIHTASQINTVDYADKCLQAVWLEPHQLLQPTGWAVISEWTVTFWKLAPRSSSLSLCISVSPHHSGGRPTKAFVFQWAVQQKLHKPADSVLLTEGKKEIEKSREKAEEGRKKDNYGRGKAAWKCVCLRERARERTCWIKRKTGRYIEPELQDRPAGPRWIWRREKWREGEAVWAASGWMDGGKWDVVSPGRESCLAPARPEI